jgi:hypothetical protein
MTWMVSSSGSTVAVAVLVVRPRGFLAGGSTSSGSAVAVFLLGRPLRFAGTSAMEAVSDPFSETIVTPLLDALACGIESNLCSS